MWQMPLLTFAAVLLVQAAEGARTRQLRASESALTAVATFDDPEDFDLDEKKKAIKEKWSKMDDFLGIMFKMACTWKHKNDVDGEIAEMIKEEEIPHRHKIKATEKLQAENVKRLERACGMIVAKGEKKCRQTCADRLGDAMQKRMKCDRECVTAYFNFEHSCHEKAKNLEEVYAMNIKMAEARKNCHEGFCSHLPTVWLKSEEDEQKEEVDKRCENYCSEDNIKMRCEQKWAVNVDFKMSDVEAKCAEESKVKQCFDDKKDGISSDHDACKEDGKTSCEDDHSECMDKGEDDKAKEFCDERKKMCSEQVTDKCLKNHKKDLNEAKKDCEEENSEEFKKCKSETLAEMEEKEMDECIDKRTPTCDEDCHGKCKVDKMNKCLDDLKSDDDPTEMFCTDFWRLLHESSEVDPTTGRPIV
eukprot:gnl/TRDRNA2_/TRDRNA2_61183_c0_seq1.p1 gnl/TRDRNA2_/TRDRNA2_61183_c0~~gnl/TRDRNA2_/TRDRNA2_61183_c0_seq1.p1  ORF type:complete len:448 (-),score=156.02 gnl/TRDRNA2_/TRDRNA2_61183_c0_seq1:201-1451(-)